MHDPDVLLYELRKVGLDVWHSEPRGHDSGSICGHQPIGRLALLAWTARHFRHLWLRWWPAYRVRHWVIDRCDHCGRRFLWRDQRHSYMSSASHRVWHEQCMSLRQVRGQLDDLTGYVLGTADETARWRAKYRLDGIAHPELVGGSDA